MELPAARINVPGPLFVNPFVPARTICIVAELVLTTMEGDVAVPLSSVSALPPVSSQLLVPPVSPNFSVPRLRAESSVTVWSEVRLSALKSAVLPAPLAMMPFSHFVLSLQAPSASTFQVPLTAFVCGTALVNKPTMEVLNAV